MSAAADTPENRSFVTYQRGFRHGEPERRNVEREWSRKSVQERQEIAEAIDGRARASQDYEQALAAISVELEWIRRVLPERARDLPRLEHYIDHTLQPLVRLSLLALTLAMAWDDLVMLETEQFQTSSAVSIRHSQEWAAHWHRQCDALEIETANWERFLGEEQHDVPLDAQGQSRIPQPWVEEFGSAEEKMVAAQRDDRRRDRLGLEEHRPNVIWQAWREISGGLSKVYLWLAFDTTTDRVVDRVYRKDIYCEERYAHDVRLFDGDLRDAAKKTPWELSCHRSMNGIDQLKNVVRLREGQNPDLFDPSTNSLRLYVEWAPYDDLRGLLSRYAVYGGSVPEPFVWSVAECLVDCAKAMEDGHMDDYRAGQGWAPIVHRDIKPANIFLGYAEPARYPQYPKPLLADFGLAFKTTPNDPTEWRGPGTRGWNAPEQSSYYDRATGTQLPGPALTPATNIYAIGAVLSYMMRLPTEPEEPRQPIWLGDGSPPNTVYTLQMHDANDGSPVARYSQQLRHLVNRCLEFRPQDRPDAENLRTEILNALEEYGAPAPDGTPTPGPDVSRGMRSGKAARGAGALARPYALFEQPDSYQNLMTRAELPHRMVND